MFQGCTSLTGNTPTTDGLQLWERAGQTWLSIFQFMGHNVFIEQLD